MEINVLVNIKDGLKSGFQVSNAFSLINKDTKLFGLPMAMYFNSFKIKSNLTIQSQRIYIKLSTKIKLQFIIIKCKAKYGDTYKMEHVK